jgi:hypothetical protein
VSPILRHKPGDRAPAEGTYALVGHYGEATNFAVRCLPGERLPVVTIAADFGPLWYVRVDEADEQARVA